MPQTLAQMVRAKHAGVYDDLSDQELDTRVRAKFPGVYDDLPTEFGAYRDPKAKPVSPEDLTETKTSTPREFSKGVLKGATSSMAGIGEMLANAGMLPGVLPNAFGPDEMRNPTFRSIEEATTATNAAQRTGKAAEFVAEVAAPTYQLGKAGVALAKAAPALLSKAGPVAVEVASHIPVIGGPVRMARGAAKILGHVLDLAGKELPQATNAGGRLVPAETPSLTQALTDAIAEARVPDPPARVTTPPEASLPPGYTPRSTVPKPKLVKPERPAPVQAAIDAGEKKRAYFLKSAEDMATVADDALEPTGSVLPEDLPASWRTHTGQDLFPITGEEGKAVIAAMRQELKDRGLSVGQAIASVSKNKTMPTQVRAQLLRALGGGK